MNPVAAGQHGVCHILFIWACYLFSHWSAQQDGASCCKIEITSPDELTLVKIMVASWNSAHLIVLGILKHHEANCATVHQILMKCDKRFVYCAIMWQNYTLVSYPAAVAYINCSEWCYCLVYYLSPGKWLTNMSLSLDTWPSIQPGLHMINGCWWNQR